MKRIFLAALLLVFFCSSYSQTITPQSLIYIWNLNNKEKMDDYIERKGFDYSKTRKEAYGSKSILYNWNGTKSMANRWIAIHMSHMFVQSLEYCTIDKNEYLNFKKFLSSNNYKLTKDDNLNTNTTYQTYENEEVRITTIRESLPKGTTYTFIIRSQYFKPAS